MGDIIIKRLFLYIWLIFLVVAPLQAAWVNVTSNLAGMATDCGELGLLSSVPGQDKVIAGIGLQGLWATTNGGTSWEKLGTGAGSAVITNRPSSIVYDPNNSDIFWESGIYNGGGIYKTTDGGITFVQLGTIGHNDCVSIDFTDPQRQLLVAGGHEQAGKLYKSINGGQSWTDIGPNLPAGTAFSTQCHVIDASTYLVGCSGWGGGTTGIFRTTDGGSTWSSTTGLPPAAEPLETKNHKLYWPLLYNTGILESLDSGKTWVQTTQAQIAKACHPVEMPDSSLATLTAGRSVIISKNGGRKWDSAGTLIPNVPEGIVYNEVRKAFFVNFTTCGTKVLSYAVLRMDYQPNSGVELPYTRGFRVSHGSKDRYLFLNKNLRSSVDLSTVRVVSDLTGRISTGCNLRAAAKTGVFIAVLKDK